MFKKILAGTAILAVLSTVIFLSGLKSQADPAAVEGSSTPAQTESISETGRGATETAGSAAASTETSASENVYKSAATGSTSVKKDTKVDSGVSKNDASSLYHIRKVSPDKPLTEILKNRNIKDGEAKINLYVNLSTRTLHFRYGDIVLKSYSIAAGENTNDGDKVKEGDKRTPRGTFYMCEKRVYSPAKPYIGTRFLLLSYPNAEDAKRGLEDELISGRVYKSIMNAVSLKKTPPQDTPLGGVIGIHGGARSGFEKDWTWGCIGMYTQDVEEVSAFVKNGTAVTIK